MGHVPRKETITEQIHEYMSEKLNESSETNSDSKIKHISSHTRKRKVDWKHAPKIQPRNRNILQIRPIVVTVEDLTGQNNMYVQHVEQNCRNCQRLGKFAKVCRSTKRIQYLNDETASSASNDIWTRDKIHVITECIQAKNCKRQ